MDVPEKWRAYPCDDYFSSSFAIEGYWDEPGQLWLIEPVERVEEDIEANFLQVGRPGFDSIGFGYRKGNPGFWAYHRMVKCDFQYLAASLRQFIDGWFTGQITV